MASLLLHQLDPELTERLRVRAALHGCSMEAEACLILKAALDPAPSQTGADLLADIRRYFGPLGGVELELPPRVAGREPPTFE